MKKIKSVKLRNGYSIPGKFVPAGTELIKNAFDNWGDDDYLYCESYIELYPDFFDITYEEEWFEVGDEKAEYFMDGDGFIHDGYRSTEAKKYYIHGHAGTKAEMEYKRMHNETMHYFRKLAEELNGDWRYEVGKVHQVLISYNGIIILSVSTDYRYPCIKFSYNITIDQITSRAKPEMLENYKRICQNPY